MRGDAATVEPAEHGSMPLRSAAFFPRAWYRVIAVAKGDPPSGTPDVDARVDRGCSA